jgi:SNF2 family DNA or RNA helicase
MTQLHALKYKTTPFDHQRKITEDTWMEAYWGLLMEMGTGKSKVLIDTGANLADVGLIDAIVLFAPKGVFMTWIEEQLPTHWPQEQVPAMWSYWHPQAKQSLKDEWVKLSKFNGVKIFVMNIEALSYARPVEFITRFIKAMNGKVLVAVDESTTIKNMTAARTKAAIKIRSLCTHARILSGSPVTRSPVDIYAQSAFLSPLALRIPSLYAFKTRYCITKDIPVRGHNGQQRQVPIIVGYRNLDDLQEKLGKFTSRVLKSECLDLPPKLYRTRHVELTDEQADAYHQMKRNALAVIKGQQLVTAPIVITQLLRLHQIVCGHIKTDDKTVIQLKNNRVDSMMEDIEEAPEKVVIWANYQADIINIKAAIAEAYGAESVVDYYGLTDFDDRQKNMNDFKYGDKVRFFIGNPATGRYALTLVNSHCNYYYSNNHNLEFRLQSEERTHRIGQEESVTYTDMICPGTIDEIIVKSNVNKKAIADMITGDNLYEILSKSI